jgi:hypothetical protein
MSFQTKILLVLVLCLSVVSLGCNLSNFIVLLDDLSSATAVAVPLVSADFGSDGPAISGYITLATTNVPKALALIQNAPNGNVATVAAQVVTLIQSIATAPQMSSNVPAVDVVIINSVAAAAQIFLSTFQTATAGLHLSHPELMAAFTGAKAAGPVKLPRRDKGRLAKAQKRIADALAAQLQKTAKKQANGPAPAKKQ